MIETNHALPNSLRENDSSIMDTIIKKTSFEPEVLKEINRCRMYINAITIADLTEGNGNQVTQEVIKGRKDKFRTSKYKWLYLPRPPESAWKNGTEHWIWHIYTLTRNSSNDH